MKIRAGFVSNSSSSSFIIYNDKFYKDLNFLGYEFQIEREGEVEIEIIVDDKFSGYNFDVLKTIEEKIEYLVKCVFNRPCLILNEEDCNRYKELNNKYYEMNFSKNNEKKDELKKAIEDIEWKAVDILLSKIENLVEEISEILVVRIEDAYINLDSIPDRDFFKNDEKLKEFLYSGAIYFGNDNIDSIEVPIGHYIAFNENKDTDNIYYLRNSHSLIYDIDYLIGFKNERSKYFECLKKCIGKIND